MLTRDPDAGGFAVFFHGPKGMDPPEYVAGRIDGVTREDAIKSIMTITPEFTKKAGVKSGFYCCVWRTLNFGVPHHPLDGCFLRYQISPDGRPLIL
jgi:hypothetical protein